MKVAVGHSDDLDGEDAAAEIIEACREQLAGAPATAGLLFCGIDNEHEVIVESINDAFPDMLLIGGSADGEFSSGLGYAEDSSVLVVISTERVRVSAGLGRGVIADPNAAAARAVASARAGLDGEVGLCLSVPNGLKSTGNRVVQGLGKALGVTVPLCGGVSCDHMEFVQTFQYFGREVLMDSVPVLLFSDDIHIGRGAWSGWMPVGKRAPAILGEGRMVTRIGDRTAVEYVRKYLGKDVKPDSECPVAVYPPGADDFYLRSIVSYDEHTGSVTLAKSIPEGSELQLTQATRDTLLLGAERSINQALASYTGESPDLALFFSCVTRRNVLGTRAPEEDATVRRLTGGDLPYAGFYAAGEIGPISTDKDAAAVFHSESIVSLFMGEQ